LNTLLLLVAAVVAETIVQVSNTLVVVALEDLEPMFLAQRLGVVRPPRQRCL